MTIHVDGTQEGSASAIDPDSNNGENQIGGWSKNNDSYLDGKVAGLRVYSTRLSDSEIQTDYDVAGTAGSLETATKSFANAQTPNLKADVDLNGVTDVAVDVVGSPAGTPETNTVNLNANGENTYSISWSDNHTDFRVRPQPHHGGDVTRTPEVKLLELVAPRRIRGYKGSEWDSAASESGVAHESTANTDHQNEHILRQGYSYASPLESANLDRFYPLQEDSGDTLNDLGNDDKDGTNQGATQGATGVLGTTAYDFDDANSEYATFPSMGNLLDGSKDYTVRFWVNLDVLPSDNRIIFAPYADYNVTVFWADDGEMRFESRGSSVSIAGTGGSAISAATWHLIHCRYDHDGNMTIHVDGTQEGSASATDPDPTSGENQIGAWSKNDDQYLDGKVAGLRVYSTRLSDSQIQSDYDVADTPGSLETATKTFSDPQTPDLNADVNLNGVTDVAVDVIGSPAGTSEMNTVQVNANGEHTYSIPWSNSTRTFEFAPSSTTRATLLELPKSTSSS
jgi:hypothetical protein